MGKKIVSLLLIGILLFGLIGCNKDTTIPEIDMKPIEYEQSTTVKEENDTISLSLPVSAIAGETVIANTRIAERNPETYTYVITDWGDGTWSYLGPGQVSLTTSTTFASEHTYLEAGQYSVRSAVADMRQGRFYGWSEPVLIQVQENYERDHMIRRVKAISSEAKDGDHKAENISDSDNNTAFVSKGTTVIDQEAYVGYLFDDYYTLETVEIKFPQSEDLFPSNIAVEYTMDGGETWHHFTKYYYQNKYVEDVFVPMMNFPNPSGATLSLNLDGMVANGIRFTAKMFSVEKPRDEKFLTVSEMRVYGTKEKLFESSLGGSFDAALNNMFTIYGTAKSEWQYGTSLIGENPSKEYFRTGIAMIGSTEWLEWNGMKLIWTGYDEAKEAYYSTLKGTIYGEDGWQDELDGYIWATAMLSETWLPGQQHLGLQNHYTYNAIYICAVRDFLMQMNLPSAYGESATENFLEVENLLGQSVMNILETAMEYNLKILKGETGLLTILDPRNDGTENGVSSNYWDYYNFFGYQSAYENVLFYRSLGAMADIYGMIGNQERVTYYQDLQETAKQKFNETFWDEEKGRYIASVDINGRRNDFGMTFVSFMACEAGLASEEQAALIYDWIDGNRIIEGDTSTGEDIYYFKFAARSNTVDMKVAPELCWTHDGLLDPSTSTGRYGSNIQQGGAIFYTTYYDVMGRLKTLGADNAFERFNAVIDEFLIDELRRFNYGTTGAEGIIGEFPESGLVPLVFMDGFIGMSTTHEGLYVKPALPKGMTMARVREYYYNNAVYDITVSSEISKPTIEREGDIVTVRLPADSVWLVSGDTVTEAA